MLLYNSFRVILVFVVLRTTDSARKIKDGHKVDTIMNYMVYITKAQQSPTFYDAWVCGGAIVTSLFIVTSAACVEDVQYMYAIAGYDKYVNAKDIATNECTRASRKKIIYTCVPKSYEFAYDKIQKWAYIDIAAVKVESPYDFSAAQPLSGCSWVPGKIEINYDIKRQAPNTDALVFGWGHTHKWRKPGDSNDYNQETLQYSSILLMDKEECKKLYESTPDLLPIIDKYMICAMNEGNINEKGDFITKSKLTDGCVGKAERVGGKCREPVQETLNLEQDKRPIQRPQLFLWASNPTANPYAYIIKQQRTQGYNNLNSRGDQNYGFSPYANVNQNPSAVDNDDITFDDIMALHFRRQDGNRTANTTSHNYTRKAGICQNDHGGPLVTWVGKHKVLLGVASVFQLNKDLDCVGPYLFTSTQCNGAFLDCVINSDINEVETKTTTTQPTTTKPTTTKPTTTESTTTESTTTESTTTESTTTKPATTESTTTESTTTKPTTTESTTTKPTTTESTTTESTTTKPTTTESTTTESTTTESTTTESTTTESTTTESTTTESTTTESTTIKTEDVAWELMPGHKKKKKKKEDGFKLGYSLYGSDDELYDDELRLETFRSYIRRSSDFCNLPNDENRFEVIERRISWKNHPDGPAANELLEDLFERPSRPL